MGRTLRNVEGDTEVVLDPEPKQAEPEPKQADEEGGRKGDVLIIPPTPVASQNMLSSDAVPLRLDPEHADHKGQTPPRMSTPDSTDLPTRSRAPTPAAISAASRVPERSAILAQLTTRTSSGAILLSAQDALMVQDEAEAGAQQTEAELACAEQILLAAEL